ncbi:hypothetical protein SNE40_003326 [Patella caerulea]|uniref:Uncharacterized protein n=1 Tax=Patella caerulea TaxID=87958 RepID=A0AAN8KE15_PATCE
MGVLMELTALHATTSARKTVLRQRAIVIRGIVCLVVKMDVTETTVLRSVVQNVETASAALTAPLALQNALKVVFRVIRGHIATLLVRIQDVKSVGLKIFVTSVRGVTLVTLVIKLVLRSYLDAVDVTGKLVIVNNVNKVTSAPDVTNVVITVQMDFALLMGLALGNAATEIMEDSVTSRVP